jgi:hypothetical protein
MLTGGEDSEDVLSAAILSASALLGNGVGESSVVCQCLANIATSNSLGMEVRKRAYTVLLLLQKHVSKPEFARLSADPHLVSIDQQWLKRFRH